MGLFEGSGDGGEVGSEVRDWYDNYKDVEVVGYPLFSLEDPGYGGKVGIEGADDWLDDYENGAWSTEVAEYWVGCLSLIWLED